MYLNQGRTADALVEAQKAADISKRDSASLSLLGSVYATSGNRKMALELVEELKKRYPQEKASEYQIAVVYAVLGANDEAFAWLEKAFLNRRVFYGFRTAPLFASLRTDPRFNDLLRRMNLPEL